MHVILFIRGLYNLKGDFEMKSGNLDSLIKELEQSYKKCSKQERIRHFHSKSSKYSDAEYPIYVDDSDFSLHHFYEKDLVKFLKNYENVKSSTKEQMGRLFHILQEHDVMRLILNPAVEALVHHLDEAIKQRDLEQITKIYWKVNVDLDEKLFQKLKMCADSALAEGNSELISDVYKTISTMKDLPEDEVFVRIEDSVLESSQDFSNIPSTSEESNYEIITQEDRSRKRTRDSGLFVNELVNERFPIVGMHTQHLDKRRRSEDSSVTTTLNMFG